MVKAIRYWCHAFKVLEETRLAGQRSRPNLIWNDPCQAPIFRWRLTIASERQLAGIRASAHVASTVSRGAVGAARRARSPGCGARHVVSLMQLRVRAAETTDSRGRFVDETR
jgi:hypothetical protein